MATIDVNTKNYIVDDCRGVILSIFLSFCGERWAYSAFGRGRGPAMAKAWFPDHVLWWPDPLAICV